MVFILGCFADQAKIKVDQATWLKKFDLDEMSGSKGSRSLNL